MILVKAAKCIMFGLTTIPVAFGALGTGIVFNASNIGLARNPEMKDPIFTNSLIAFALIETFVVIGILLALIAYIIL